MTLFTRLHRHRLHPLAALSVGSTLLALSALLLTKHMEVVRTLRDDVLPLSVRIPQLEARVERLKEQTDVMELQALLSNGSTEELVRAFALPEETDVERLVTSLEVIRDHFQKQKMLTSMSAIDLGESMPDPKNDAATVLPVSFEVTMTEEGANHFLLLMDLAGLLTISDALTPKETALFLSTTEEENPAGLTSLEHFFGTDLLNYAREPKPFNEQLLKSFSSPLFLQTFESIMGSPRMHEALALLGGDMGQTLAEKKLWPLQFMTVEKVEWKTEKSGEVKLGLVLHAYTRGKD